MKNNTINPHTLSYYITMSMTSRNTYVCTIQFAG
jgi:hypothetical protein